MGLIIGSNSSAERVITVKNRDGSTAGSIHISSPKKKKKKRLQYSFKAISTQIMMTKTSNSASQVLTKARGKVAMLQRNLDNDNYDDTELRHAIIHAKKMERIAKKRMKHLAEEELAKQKQSNVINQDGSSIPELPDPEEESLEMSEEELKQMMEEFQQMMEEYMGESMQKLMEETGLDDLADEMLVAQQGELAPEDLEELKKKHRSEELREIMEADMKYLKAMINKLERDRQEAANNVSNGVRLEISGLEIPVETSTQPTITPQGINVDLLL